jgi:hypothetical protein
VNPASDESCATVYSGSDHLVSDVGNQVAI